MCPLNSLKLSRSGFVRLKTGVPKQGTICSLPCVRFSFCGFPAFPRAQKSGFAHIYIHMHLLSMNVTRQPAKMVNQATDSYFALIHVCQYGVLMDNAG